MGCFWFGCCAGRVSDAALTHTPHTTNPQASLLVADASVSFEITGLGDVLEPKDGVIAIGSGGTFALGAFLGCLGMGIGHGWALLRTEDRTLVLRTGVYRPDRLIDRSMT